MLPQAFFIGHHEYQDTVRDEAVMRRGAAAVTLFCPKALKCHGLSRIQNKTSVGLCFVSS